MTSEEGEQRRVFIQICTPLLHGSNAVVLRKVLDANLGWGNGLEDHIVQCPVCQRILKAGR